MRNHYTSLQKKTGFTFGIQYKNVPGIIGIIELDEITSVSRNALLGYWVGREYRGKGIATEALRLILKFGFEELLLMKICAKVISSNEISKNLLTTFQFQQEGLQRKQVFKNGEWMDLLIFGLLKDEYEKLPKIF